MVFKVVFNVIGHHSQINKSTLRSSSLYAEPFLQGGLDSGTPLFTLSFPAQPRPLHKTRVYTGPERPGVEFMETCFKSFLQSSLLLTNTNVTVMAAFTILLESL